MDIIVFMNCYKKLAKCLFELPVEDAFESGFERLSPICRSLGLRAGAIAIGADIVRLSDGLSNSRRAL